MRLRITFCTVLLACVAALNAQRDHDYKTLSVKNNLLYDLTLTPNIGVEVVADSANSFQLFYGLHPWKFSGNKKLRHWSLMPEWRHWIGKKSGKSKNSAITSHPSPLTGWFWGIHLVGGEYNIGGKKLPFGLFKPLRTHRYEGWYAGGGLTVGHAWLLSCHWRLEAALGLGYIHTRYHQYGVEVCAEDCGTGHYNYFGPTKLALNLCYDLKSHCQPVVPVVVDVPEPPKPEPYKPQYRLAYVTPKAELQKTRQLSGRAFIDFVVNKTDIRTDYRGNAAELAKVQQTIDVVRRDTFTTITHVSIHGYASPEGSYQNNTRLAAGRAQAFATYVQGLVVSASERYKAGDLFTVQSTPEDWEGLEKYLGTPATDLGDPKLLAIIRDASLSPDQKERELKRQFPQQWRYMLENIFPALRHSDYEVTYTVRPFTVEEAARVIREKPQHLSLNEMFLVANTYTPGSQDYNDVFETAVRMFPADACKTATSFLLQHTTPILSAMPVSVLTVLII